MASAVKVKGLRELNRAFARYDNHLSDELKDRLRQAAEPVRMDAERLAVGVMRVGSVPWQDMRVGVTTKVVYVAPARRATRRANMKRPKFGTRLIERAMEPALEQNKDRVVNEVEALLDTLGREWGRGG